MQLAKYLLATALILGVALNCFAQLSTSIAENYSLQEGLSDRSVSSIIKGKDGLMWIGTSNGLNKFDGYNFTVFNSDPDDSLRLLSSNIQDIRQDINDNLIILYENTTWMFNIFNPQTYELRKVEVMLRTGVHGIVRDFEIDEAGEMYVLTEGGDTTRVYRFDGRDRFELVFSLHQPHPANQTYQMVLRHLSSGDFLINDSALGLQWIGPNGEIGKYFQQRDFGDTTRPDRITYPNRINFLHEDQFGQIWVAWDKVPGIFLLKYGNYRFERKAGFDQSRYYSAIYEDDPGNLLVLQSQPGGIQPEILNVFAYTPNDQIFDFTHVLDENRTVTCIYSEDFFKTIFLGIDDGFRVVRNNRFRIKTYLAQEAEVASQSVIIKGIAGDDDNRYVYLAAESNHWYRLDISNELMELDTLTFRNSQTGRPLELSGGVNLVKDADGFIWGAARESRGVNRLYKYDTEQCTVEAFDFPYPITSFTIADNGLFWLGCSPSENDGIILTFDPVSGTHEEFYLSDGSNPIPTSAPQYIFQSSSGSIWVGTTNDGVYAFDTDGKNPAHYSTDSDELRYRISHNSCLVIYEDEQGKIFLGTQNGLNIIDQKNQNIKVLRRRDGLCNNTVTGIVPDGSGHFWISTNNGISFYDPRDDSFKNFFQADGFSANAFNPFSFYRDGYGRFYFGSVNGLNVFMPKDLLLDEPKPTVLLTRIERYRSTDDSLMVMESNLHKIEQLVIEPYDTYFALHFTFPEFSRPNKNQYRMKWEGSDKWTLYNDPIITFHKLPAGNYTLLVEGSDANGNWSAKPFVLPIKVKKPFYKQTWVQILLLLAIFSIIYGIFQSRMRQRLKMEQLRTKLASDLHDEVSGLLSGIAMQSDLVQFMVTDSKVQNRLKTIGEVSRKAMSKMSDVIWSIDSRKDRLEDLVGRMHEHADEMLLPLNIRYDIQISHKLDRTQKVPANIRQDLYFIYKEAINNIAKHSNAGRVFIIMRQQGNFFELRIKDNGTTVEQLAPVSSAEQAGTDAHQGIPTAALQQSKKKSGQGLSNLRMRAERLKGNLEIKTENGYSILLRMKKFM
jgi:signal transduction histidine kinase/ligand-binding sensor domain-containing protein